MGLLFRRILISLVIPFAWRKWREHRAAKRQADRVGRVGVAVPAPTT